MYVYVCMYVCIYIIKATQKNTCKCKKNTFTYIYIHHSPVAQRQLKASKLLVGYAEALLAAPLSLRLRKKKSAKP
jgi:hypothetical protein